MPDELMTAHYLFMNDFGTTIHIRSILLDLIRMASGMLLQQVLRDGGSMKQYVIHTAAQIFLHFSQVLGSGKTIGFSRLGHDV